MFWENWYSSHLSWGQPKVIIQSDLGLYFHDLLSMIFPPFVIVLRVQRVPHVVIKIYHCVIATELQELSWYHGKNALSHIHTSPSQRQREIPCFTLASRICSYA